MGFPNPLITPGLLSLYPRIKSGAGFKESDQRNRPPISAHPEDSSGVVHYPVELTKIKKEPTFYLRQSSPFDFTQGAMSRVEWRVQ